MLTILNLSIIVLLLIMVAIWATYGFFSAFIHLVIVVAAGVLSFALWEPVSYMLLGRMPAYAHGVGLLAPFALIVIVLRVAFDKLCKANVHMPRIADQIGGGACGFCSGVLAFGLLLNGANFLPMDREVMGWQPYIVDGNKVNDNEDGGQIWVAVHEWSAGFYNMLSTGSMSPTGGTPLAVGRPDLARRALLTRMPADKHQFRAAHPGSVAVTGVYAIPASEDAVYGLAQRIAILAFIKHGYEMPGDIDFGEDGMGLRDAVLNDLDSRFQNSAANGKPSDMIDTQAVLEVARTPQYKFQNATSRQNFPRFVQMVADKMGQDLVRRLKPVMGKGKVLYVVDTAWNNEHPGTYNDGKLRVAIPQVGLQAGEDMIAPIGYSIQYSQNTGGRVFTEIISPEAAIETKDTAYTTVTEVNMGWVFSLSEGQKPEYFFVRELRFDLSKLDAVDESGSKVNQNIGAVAHVVGAPLLPSPADLEKEQGTSKALAEGVKITGSDTRADLSEKLPGAFSGSAVSYKFDKDADPWTLTAGRGQKLPRSTRGSSTISEITISNSERLVRLKLDSKRANSLYGRAIGVAKSLNVMRIRDEGGNPYDAIGYAMLRADGTMDIDIRSEAEQGGLSASELPKLRAGDTLMIYFQVPIGKKVVAYELGNEKMKFEEPLPVEKDTR